VWRLQSPERLHYSRPIPNPTLTGLLPPLYHLHQRFKNVSRGGISSDSCPSRRHSRLQLPHTSAFFEFPFMSFGLKNTAQTFQRFKNEILQDLDFCFTYLDDILAFRRSPKTRPTCTYPLHPTPNLQYRTATIQVRFLCSWNIIPGTPNLVPGFLVSPGTSRRSSSLSSSQDHRPIPKFLGNSKFLLGVSSPTQHPFKPLFTVSFLAPKLRVPSGHVECRTHYGFRRL
jgi:hypothetical protein